MCVFLLLTGCNGGSTSTSSLASPESVSSGGEITTAPEESSAAEELPLVETPTVERNTSTTARSVRIISGSPAPFSGRLLNDEAMSYIHAASVSLEEACTAAIRRQRDRDAARLTLDVGELRLQLNADRERARIILEGRDREIARLLELNETLTNEINAFPWESVLVGVGSGALGLVLGFVAGALYSP